jgi:hypothetical protein
VPPEAPETLEDEFGIINVIIWRDHVEQNKLALMHSKLLQVKDKLIDESDVLHLIAGHLKYRRGLLEGLDVRSRIFTEAKA